MLSNYHQDELQTLSQKVKDLDKIIIDLQEKTKLQLEQKDAEIRKLRSEMAKNNETICGMIKDITDFIVKKNHQF